MIRLVKGFLMLTVTAACSGACPSGQYQSAACCATSDRVCTGKQFYVVFCFDKFSVVFRLSTLHVS